MNLQSDPQPVAPSPMSEPRPMYWSIRRELWENRSIYVAPLLVTAVVLFASLISTMGLPRRIRAAAGDPVKERSVIVAPFSLAPAPIMLATFIVGFFYSIDALYGERRDRSILFWKSLPVSDRTTVLSKAIIPMVVLPLIAFVLGVLVQRLLLIAATMALLGSRMSPAVLWHELPLFQEMAVMFYGLAVHVLWFAPIYAWLMLVSAWAKRSALLWAVMPFLAVAAVERIVFSTSYFGWMLRYRLDGAMHEAFAVRDKSGHAIIRLSQLDPVRFLSAPGLWVGLLFAAACIAAAIRLRRNREPI